MSFMRSLGRGVGRGQRMASTAKNTRVAQMVANNKGKIAIGMGAIGLARGGMSRTGSASDKPRGRPTGPYMY